MQSLWKKIQNLWVTRELTLPNGRVVNNTRMLVVESAAITLNVREHSDKPILLNRVAGTTVTLPRATGSGARFEFYIGQNISGGNTIIKVDNSVDVFVGRVTQSADAGNGVAVYDTAPNDDTITLNGSTQGGLAGDRILFTDIRPGFWALDAFTSATGTEANPLSATV